MPAFFVPFRSKNTMKITANLVFERETKNTIRYMEVDEKGNEKDKRDPNTVVGTLYVQKSHFSDEHPESVTVSVEWED